MQIVEKSALLFTRYCRKGVENVGYLFSDFAMPGSGFATGNGGQTSDAREAHLSHYSTARGQFTENGRVFTSERELEAYRWDRAHGNAF